MFGFIMLFILSQFAISATLCWDDHNRWTEQTNLKVKAEALVWFGLSFYPFLIINVSRNLSAIILSAVNQSEGC